MKRILALLVVLPLIASANVTPPRIKVEHTLFSVVPLSALAAATLTGSHILAARPFTVTRVFMHVRSASGGGAGTTVVTLTDGTNTCTATWACAATSGTGVKAATVANGAGTGCVFPAGASITSSISTAGCTTTQPSALNLSVVGVWP